MERSAPRLVLENALMAERYPAVEPYESGMLAVTDGHRLYWEMCGTPDGTPAVYLHGGLIPRRDLG
ncbi:MAG: hypothetical protein ACRDTE_01610 [Pseudonocardiaceae bacterium]